MTIILIIPKGIPINENLIAGTFSPKFSALDIAVILLAAPSIKNLPAKVDDAANAMY